MSSSNKVAVNGYLACGIEYLHHDTFSHIIKTVHVSQLHAQRFDSSKDDGARRKSYQNAIGTLVLPVPPVEPVVPVGPVMPFKRDFRI